MEMYENAGTRQPDTTCGSESEGDWFAWLLMLSCLSVFTQSYLLFDSISLTCTTCLHSTRTASLNMCFFDRRLKWEVLMISHICILDDCCIFCGKFTSFLRVETARKRLQWISSARQMNGRFSEQSSLWWTLSLSVFWHVHYTSLHFTYITLSSLRRGSLFSGFVCVFAKD